MGLRINREQNQTSSFLSVPLVSNFYGTGIVINIRMTLNQTNSLLIPLKETSADFSGEGRKELAV